MMGKIDTVTQFISKEIEDELPIAQLISLIDVFYILHLFIFLIRDRLGCL